MSDSEELLFGNITDADGDSDSNKMHNGTTYPQHLQTIAMDSEDSDSLDDLRSSSKPIQIKRKKSQTKFEREKSRKRIKEIAMNGTSLNDSPVGEAQLNNNGFVDIDRSASIEKKDKSTKLKQMRRFLNGKSKRKDHEMISVEDSDDEYEDDDDDDDTLKTMISNNTLSIILSLIAFITLLICVITVGIVAVLLFALFYILYLLECFVNKTWKEMKDGESAEGSTKLLDSLRNTAPVIDCFVECYHFETKHEAPRDKKTIVWLQGKPQNGADFFEEIGFNIKHFKWDWNGINYVAEKENQGDIAAIVVPHGFEGKRIEKAMLQKFNAQDDDNWPHFFEWNENINELIEEFKKRNVIREDKKKIVTHTSSMIYDYNEWNDVSVNYPNLKKHQITKLNITKTYRLENEETRNDFDEQKQAFLSLNNKDEFQSVTENLSIRGFKHCITIKNDIESTPFWYTVHGYWICSVLLFTLYPRYKYYTRCAIKKWNITKAISI